MLGLKMTKKGWGSDNVRSRSKSRERVSLLGNGRSHSKDGLRGRENRRRTRGEQEMVSLLGKPSPGKLKKSDLGRRRKKYSNFNPRSFNIRWTRWTYLGLLLLTAFVTNKVIKKGKKILHWEDFDSLLEPQAPQEERCFEETIEIISHVTGKTRKFPCSCPTPNVALENKIDPLWRSNHERMVSEAKNYADKDLDIVFFGDGVVEQLSGSRDLGKTMVDGMENYFDKTYKKGYGATFNAIALGSTGDTGPNLLWHWENGIQQANLRPKLWYLVVGSNELYVHKCNDDFVKASVLNVAKRIFEDQPDAKIVVHGIFPRKDVLDSKTNNLGDLWNRAQGINLDIRKFIKKHSSRVQYMNLGQTLMGNGRTKGRKSVNPALIEGLFPTPKGMVKWSDLLVKKVKPILKGFDREAHRKQTKKPDGDAGKP